MNKFKIKFTYRLYGDVEGDKGFDMFKTFKMFKVKTKMTWDINIFAFDNSIQGSIFVQNKFWIFVYGGAQSVKTLKVQ